MRVLLSSAASAAAPTTPRRAMQIIFGRMVNQFRSQERPNFAVEVLSPLPRRPCVTWGVSS
jgi:hypothetical protein